MAYKGGLSPSKPVQGAYTMQQPVPIPFPALYLQQPSALVPAGLSHSAFVSGDPMPVSQPPFEAFQSGSSSSQAEIPYMAQPPPPFQYYHMLNAPSRSSSAAPSTSGVSRAGSYADSASGFYQSSQASSSRGHAGGKKRARLTSERSNVDLRETADCQTAFDTQVVRLTTFAGLPLNWVSNPEFRKFVEILNPNIVTPSRKRLTQTLLPGFMKDVRAFTKSKAYNRIVTIQCDGWSGINNVHLIAFMASTTDDVSGLFLACYLTYHLSLGVPAQSLRDNN